MSYSAPVGIELKAKSTDVANAVVSEEKGITTESGNPYGAFVADARGKLGRDPGGIEIERLTLTLGAASDRVAALDEVFTGDVDVAFLVNDTNNTYDVAHFINPAGVGPIGVSTLNFDWGQVAAQDLGKLLGGSFKVVIRGPAATGFEGKGADAQLQLTFTFTAFE